jgi:hypothetical protein
VRRTTRGATWQLPPHLEEVAVMINLRLGRIAATALLITLAGPALGPAAARPIDPDPPAAHRITFTESALNCPLRRIDRQLVRCDNLTGDGVPAPLFIPEL